MLYFSCYIIVGKMNKGAFPETQLSLSDHYEYGNGVVHQLEGRMKILRQQLSNHIDNCLLEAFTEILHLSNNHVVKDKRLEHIKPVAERRKGGIGEKVFAYRRSIFSELFEISHFRTLQNIFVAVIICWAINTALSDAISGGHWQAALPELEIVYLAFYKFSVVAYTWVILMALSLAVYPLLQLWIFIRNSFSDYQNFVDILFLGAWILYEVSFVVVPCWKVVVQQELPFGSAFAFACEQTRMLMKIHAFLRENVRRVLHAQSHEESSISTEYAATINNKNEKKNGQEVRHRKRTRLTAKISSDDAKGATDIISPESKHKPVHTTYFGHYLYFLFAPTLVYRDHYPRTNNINWWFVFTNLCQMVLCVMYSYYLISRYLMPEVCNLARTTEVSMTLFVVSWSRCATPGILLFVLCHYGFLHSWLNAFAEMLRFGDREFYKDWWNAVSFSAYYRDWNRVVHDWLHVYVYADVIRLFGPKRRILAACSVFGLSCFFHQYIIVAAMRFYLPFFEFSMFITGLLAIYVTPKASNRNRPLNVAMWVAMIFGNALMICLYTMEWAARQRYLTAFPNDQVADLFVPRLIYSGNSSSELP